VHLVAFLAWFCGGIEYNTGVQRILLFFKSAGTWGIGLMTGGVAAYSLSIFEHIAGHSLSAFVWVTIGIALFMVGAFLAWNEQFNKAMLAGNPELCIEYAKAKGQIAPPPLVVKSLGGGNAYRVKLRDISNRSAVLVFQEVSQLESRQSFEATATFSDFTVPTPFFNRNLEAFLKTVGVSGTDIMETIEAQLTPKNIRVVLDYYNVSEMRFTAEFELRSAYAWDEVYTVFIRRYFNPQ
jgi:hypothetical protein